MSSHQFRSRVKQETLKQQIAQQQTQPYPSILSTPHTILNEPVIGINTHHREETTTPETKHRPRIVGTVIVGVIALILYFVWKPAAPASQAIATPQHATETTTPKSLAPDPTAVSSTIGGDIQVYIIGAVQHPGVYTLANNARVYQLLQAAGGTLSNANLTAINMAARLSDGQEIYLPHIGETPIPAMSGTTGTTNSGDPAGLVNINTASADELRQNLHLSSKSAQDIVNYRLQHGAFSSVNALAQVLSKAVFDKIKDKVTI
jgi:competence protein ComEA